jgi:hypothetical protein
LASGVAVLSLGHRARRQVMRAYPRERFSSEVQLTPATVAVYAHAAGDTNPVHHDGAFAASTRYGRLIASGTHTTALLLGLTASHFSQHGAMVGLEFWVRFRRPIYADETIRLEWLASKGKTVRLLWGPKAACWSPSGCRSRTSPESHTCRTMGSRLGGAATTSVNQ